MKPIVLAMLFVFGVGSCFAQKEFLPQDYLDKSFHAGRRDALRKIMPDSSVAVIFAYPQRTYSNDVEYVYHANPDMYYFSGYKEPNSMLIIFKEPQTVGELKQVQEILFVQRKDSRAEQWTGIRMGAEGAKEKLGITASFDGAAFAELPVDFTAFKKILVDNLPEGVADNPYSRADLYELIEQFAKKTNMPEDLQKDERFKGNLFYQLTASLREVKTPEEMDLLRKAVEISCVGQREVMKAVRPNMSETEVQGLHEYVHKKYGAESVGYPSIVGAGNNGCVLHYVENNRTNVGQQLLLMDVGAEYHGYTADVTRTIPANGRFTDDQKVIYNLVYDAQEAAFRLSKEGASWNELNKAATEVIANGLLKLGVIKKKEEVNRYYPHGLGHHIGLDVHDRGTYTRLKKDMVITIEPGIYIPENSPCDKRWWGIAVRIEDDLLIKEKDYELLSAFVPRKWDEIEKLIAEESALDDFKLPPLKSGKKAF